MTKTQEKPASSVAVGEEVFVRDDELGLVSGIVTGRSREGYPLVSFGDAPAIVVFPDMLEESP